MLVHMIATFEVSGAGYWEPAAGPPSGKFGSTELGGEEESLRVRLYKGVGSNANGAGAVNR